jgi:hypothetical protein
MKIMGGYSPTQTNGMAIFVDPSEFWSGPWNEATNGWRVQLRVYNRTNFAYRAGVAKPFSTNLMLSVEWGSPVKDSGGGYFVAPNGKFDKFELLDGKGNVVPPKPSAGRNLLGRSDNRITSGGQGLTYGTDRPAWLSLEKGSLVAAFPETVSTNVYPRFADTGQMAGEIWSVTNRPPACISLLELDDTYYVADEGDYTLTVQPVLYRRDARADAGVLRRVDLPSVTTKVHLAPVTRNMGGYSVMRATDGHWIFVNPSEFWNGVWKEGSDGWRVQLRVYPQSTFGLQRGIWGPVSTNLVLCVEWGSQAKDSGGGYYLTPNGKFAKFELQDANGKVVSPNPNAGTNLLGRLLDGHTGNHIELTYPSLLPAWAAPNTESLVAHFPRTVSTNVYPRSRGGYIAGDIWTVTNRPPTYISYLKLDEVYSVTNEGDYTLTVQPVLYKQGSHAGAAILDRVDLPAVSTTVHLVRNAR